MSVTIPEGWLWLSRRRSSAGALKLIGGTTVGQLFLFAAAPFLTRLYTPDDFGALAVYAGVLSILGVLASFRFELAIPLEQSHARAAPLLRMTIALACATGLVTAVALLFGGTALAEWVGAPGLKQTLWMLPFNVMLFGVYQALAYHHVTVDRYGLLSGSKGVQGATQTGVQLIGAGVAGGAETLAGGVLFGQAAATASLLRGAPLAPQAGELRIWRDLLLTHRNFAGFTTAAALVDAAGLMLPPLILSVMFSAAAAGHFSLTMSMLLAPALLLAHPIAQVIYPAVARVGTEGEAARSLVGRLTIGIACVGLPIFTWVALNGPPLFAMLFGREWQQSGYFAALLAPALLLLFVTAPLTSFAFVHRKQQAIMWFSGAIALSRIGSLVVGGFADSLTAGIVLYSGTSSIGYIVFLLWVLRFAGADLRAVVPRIAAATLMEAAVFALLFTFWPTTTPLLLMVVSVPVVAIPPIILWTVTGGGRNLQERTSDKAVKALRPQHL